MNTNKENIKGIKLRSFNIAMMIVAGISFIILIFSTVRMSIRYDDLIVKTDDYLACENDAYMLKGASDYLTEQVRLYVEDMDAKYMWAYFEEVNVTRRREKACESLTTHHSSDSAEQELLAALNSSNELMEREIYAMKLVAAVLNTPNDELPAEVAAAALTTEDVFLSNDEKLELARVLVFNEAYQDKKAEINGHLDSFLKSVLQNLKKKQQDSEYELGRSLAMQRIFVALLFILYTITFVAITILVVRPLRIYIKRIKSNNTLEIIGSYEFKYLALTYNDIYTLHVANEEKLQHKAEHDPLTGILNRSAFEELKDMLHDRKEPMTLILVDIDLFKEINDHYGHEIGDHVLQTVAAHLSENFHSDDFVIRLGGDEFCVVAVGSSKQRLSEIKYKFDNINYSLQHPKNGLPAASLSVGAACSDSGFSEELYRQADMALYKVKESGRCGFNYFVK